jgi:hypothetical protein
MKILTNCEIVNDNQEIDWEILTSTTLTSSPNVPAGIWATNQVKLKTSNGPIVLIKCRFNPGFGSRNAFHARNGPVHL